MWPFTIKENSIIDTDYKPTISFDNSFTNKLTEQFRGEVEKTEVKFPKELGEEHPFSFKELEELYKKFGFFTAVIDKYVDFVVGPGFYVECDDERAKTIIDDFMTDVNFDTLLRTWTKEALIKGNGFMEIGGSKKEGVKGLKVLNANYMYVTRDKYGKVTGYNQYKGAFDKFAKEKVVPFNPSQIAHVAFNVVGDCAYGIGIGYSALLAINNFLQQEKDCHQIMNRKANSPLHAQLGKVDGNIKIIPKPEDVVAFGALLETMTNKTEWSTDPLVNFKVIDFGNIGEKFSAILENDINMLFYIFQIPPELMGMANIPEGMANVRMDAFQRRIQSIQAELEKIIEQQIFKRVLNANGLDVHVEFEWGAPSTIAVEGRMTLISDMIKSPMSSIVFKDMLEREMVNLLKLDIDEYEEGKAKEDEERKREEQRPQPIVPGQNAGFPQKPVPKAEQPKQPKPEENYKDIITKLKKEFDDKLDKMKEQPRKRFVKSMRRISLLPPFRITKSAGELEESAVKEEVVIESKIKREFKNYEYEKSCLHCTESIENINDVEEWLGFNYKKYLGQIETILAVYQFNQIKAINEIELKAGYLSDNQIETLREILDNGFKKGLGMKEMAKQVDKKVGLTDLYRMTEDGNIKTGASGLPILAKSAEKRSISIIRSEVTRLANKGAIEYYKINDVVNIKWVASFGDRTCPECEALNGQIFKIGEEPDMPLHPTCRCTYAPVVELV